MLLFHEGLPGAGKSYAAIKDHVVPALRKGRTVVAYIEGLDHARIALVAGIPEERCRELLIQLTKEQVPAIYDHVVNDAFVVIDELQDFWPSSRQKLEPAITEFITQHRHRGLDVLCMGQVLMDCHAIWRNRVDQCVHFYQRDAVGKPDEYKWSVRKRESNGKFAEVTSGVARYEPEYFGCYASHTVGTTNVDKYVDQRANVWSSAVVRKWLPLAGVVALCSLAFVVWVFKGGGLIPKTPTIETVGSAPAVQQAANPASKPSSKPAEATTTTATTTAKTEDREPLPGGDLIDQLTGAYRIRVGGTIRSQTGQQAGFLEWRGADNAIKETLSYRQLAGMGWLVLVSTDGDFVVLSKLNRKYFATAWPVEDTTGKTSQATQRQVAGAAVKPS